MSVGDQAAGLRRWAEQFGRGGVDEAPSALQEAPSAEVAEAMKLMVVGLPGSRSEQTALVRGCLTRWQANGHRWVGDVARWKVVALEIDSPHLAVLASQQARWGLWVEDDSDGFRLSWNALRRLHAHGGPQRLLALHAGIPSHAGLLRNLKDAAATYLGTELLLLPEQPGATC